MDYPTRLSHQTGAFGSPALRQITLEVEKVRGVNLGQGVCNLPAPEVVLNAAAAAAGRGLNRYTNPRGLASLRHAIARKLSHFNGIEVDPETQIMVTCGATAGFEAACAVLLNPGDEVVVFEPYYPYHVQALKRYQAIVKTIPLKAPTWDLDFGRVSEALSARTKFVLINTPGNPTGRVFSRSELEILGKLLAQTNCLVVTDETYEYMTFDGQSHVSAAAVASLSARTITIGGYSKTFSITGWRIGYAVAPPEIAEPMTAVLDAIYVCAPSPLQQGVAEGIVELGDNFYAELRSKYEAKRNKFFHGLRRIGLEPQMPAGAYYMICGFDRLFPALESAEFVDIMIRESGVGAVPSSDFVGDPSHARWVRFCLAQDDAVLEDALTRLERLSAAQGMRR
ncbi:MAG: pyridoxal phosphate-dependent aminotransferase [Fimbriimonadaceae bacterium]